jgi:site-specific recombinase XerD
MSGFSAIRKLAAEVADNGLLAPDLAAAIARVRRAKRHGVRAGNWLTLEQAERLLDTPGSKTNKGKRDRTLLALLVACGLRRQELIKATTFGGALSWKFGLVVRHPKQ